jgi:hypothetical protein
MQTRCGKLALTHTLEEQANSLFWEHKRRELVANNTHANSSGGGEMRNGTAATREFMAVGEGCAGARLGRPKPISLSQSLTK